MAMLYLGYPANSVDPDHLRAVEQLLKAVRPSIKYFSSTKTLLDLPSEEVCVAMSWSGDYSVASARAAEAGLDIDLGYTIPSEGSVDWYDVMYIPADAPHPDNAYLFLDYLMEPEVIAVITNKVGQANGNAASLPYVAEAVRNDPSIYPSEEVYRRLSIDRSWSPEQMHAVNRVWTRIKAAR